MQSSTNPTGLPSNSASRSATGRRLNFGSRLPLGRPRWLASIAVAPASSAYVIVGRDARSLVSSPMRPSLRGTLKSTRMKTRFPLRSRSLIETFAIGLLGPKGPGLQPLLHQQAKQVDTPTGVAPFVVVPGEHLHEIAVHDFRVGRVHD